MRKLSVWAPTSTKELTMKKNNTFLGAGIAIAVSFLSGCPDLNVGPNRTVGAANAVGAVGGAINIQGEYIDCPFSFCNIDTQGVPFPVNQNCVSEGCSTFLDSESDVTLTANPWPGFEFVRWSGGGCGPEDSPVCVVEVGQGLSVKAHFTYSDGVHPFEAQANLVDERLRYCAQIPAFRNNLTSLDQPLTIECNGRTIRSLEGIGDLTGLTKLSIEDTLGGNVPGVEELLQLSNLQELDLRRSQLNNYEFLFNHEYPELHTLKMGSVVVGFQVPDFNGLSRERFPQLEHIVLSSNPGSLSDISALVDMVTGDDAAPLVLQGETDSDLAFFNNVPCEQILAFKNGLGRLLGNGSTACSQ